jgi:hypothetical protein
MERRLFLVFLVLIGSFVMTQENEDMYNKSRLLIYGKTPVDKAIQLSGEDLESYRWYGFYCIGLHNGSGSRGDLPNFDGTKKLSRNESDLLLFLTSLEGGYRDRKSDDDFLVFLVDTRNRIASQYSAELYSTMSNWIYFYEWKIK